MAPDGTVNTAVPDRRLRMKSQVLGAIDSLVAKSMIDQLQPAVIEAFESKVEEALPEYVNRAIEEMAQNGKAKYGKKIQAAIAGVWGEEKTV